MKKTNARRAAREMSLPQLGPMNCVLTAVRGRSNFLTKASCTSPSWAWDSVSVCARTVSLPTDCTRISPCTMSPTVERTSSCVTSGPVTRNSAPPRNSMPRVSCNVNSDTIETTSRAADTPYQILRRAMKS